MRWIQALGSELFEWLMLIAVFVVLALLFVYIEWTLPIAVIAVFAIGVYNKIKRK